LLGVLVAEAADVTTNVADDIHGSIATTDNDREDDAVVPWKLGTIVVVEIVEGPRIGTIEAKEPDEECRDVDLEEALEEVEDQVGLAKVMPIEIRWLVADI
jgi:hypothetical protein